MGTSDTKIGEKIALQDDDTFTISHDGRTLKFKLDRDQRSVELVSASAPAQSSEERLLTEMSSASLLRAITSPKVSLEEDLLKKLSKAKSVVFSNVIRSDEDFQYSLAPLSKFSHEMTKRGGEKPFVVFRVAGKGGAASRVNIDSAMRTIRGRKHALDAHIVSIPGTGKKA